MLKASLKALDCVESKKMFSERKILLHSPLSWRQVANTWMSGVAQTIAGDDGCITGPTYGVSRIGSSYLNTFRMILFRSSPGRLSRGEPDCGMKGVAIVEGRLLRSKSISMQRVWGRSRAAGSFEVSCIQLRGGVHYIAPRRKRSSSGWCCTHERCQGNIHSV
jgi:hypothetical protein